MFAGEVAARAASGITVLDMATAVLPARSIIPVSGVSFRQEALRDVVEGDRVTLIPVTHPNDPSAVEIRDSAGTLLGYVPRSLNQRFDRGQIRCATITDVLRNDGTWGLRIQLTADPHPATTSTTDTITGDGVAADSKSTDDSGADDSATAAVMVTTRGGRALGMLDRVENGRVHVIDADGRQAMYPETVVVIGAGGT
jgi:hypothetical protein